jgi:hypothetical protein
MTMPVAGFYARLSNVQEKSNNTDEFFDTRVRLFKTGRPILAA